MPYAREDTTQEPRFEPVVGILVGDGFDEWLDGLGMSLNAFSQQMMGSWVFNYVEALQAVGVRSVLFCVSTRVTALTRLAHHQTGVTLVVLPTSRISRLVKWFLMTQLNCLAQSELRPLKRAWQGMLFLTNAYLATPLFPLFCEIRNEGCRSLLVQDYESTRFDLCVLLGRIKRVLVFGTFTGALPNKLFLRPLRGLALKLCSGLAIGARVEAERVKAQYGIPEAKVSLIYSPVDLRVFYQRPQDQVRTQLGIPPLAKLAIYHGRIELSYKGLDVLLKGWGLLTRTHSEQDLRLLIMGTGTDAEEFGRLLSENQIRGVRWLNKWINDRNLIRCYLSSADVYVFPSRGDACPNSVIEAMACGLPIVASDVNGIADIIEGGEESGGLLVPPGNAAALTGALKRVMLDPEFARELGLRARHRVEKCFSVEKVGKQLSTLLLSGHP
jgi:starch synthase